MNGLLNNENFVDYTNDIFNDNSSRYILKGINEINNYIPTQIENKLTPDKIGTNKNLIYKSIFPRNERIIRNKFNYNNVDENKNLYQISKNENKNYDTKKQIYNQQRKNRRLMNKIDNSKHNNSLSNNYYNNDYSQNINYIEKYMNINLKDFPNSSNNKRRSRYKVNTLYTTNTENGRNLDIDIYSDLKGIKNLKK